MANDPKSPAHSLNMPETAFPMRGDMPKREPEFLSYWKDQKVIEARMQKNRATSRKFFLPDGPPYANGGIHFGHILNKVLKDMVAKYHAMKGDLVKFVPGFDCHGLPIERAAAQEIKDLDKKPVVELRAACRQYAQKWINTQTDEFSRLGIFALWETPYRTMDYRYEGRTARFFGEMVKAGSVYRGLKPVQWCPTDSTALANAEVEYDEHHQSPSIFVKFALTPDSVKQFLEVWEMPETVQSIHAVVWTTTPWTLPSNLAIAYSQKAEYVAVLLKERNEVLLVAHERIKDLRKDLGLTLEVISPRHEESPEQSHFSLQGFRAVHPFAGREVPFVESSHVTMDAGTGLVHIAPGHGADDYLVGQRYKLGLLSPVDDRGRFTAEAGKYVGMKYSEANPVIIEDMRASGALVHASTFVHKYPVCWRCKKPIIFRATPQWFASMDSRPGVEESDKLPMRAAAMQEIDNVTWIPKWGRERIAGMVNQTPDWCLSRQRLWGVPIVAFYCQGCNEVHLEPSLIDRAADIFEKQGCDPWWVEPASHFLPEGFACKKCGHKEFRKETDILDVWFDSGVFWYAVGADDAEMGMPADLYLEGSDQHRGWFQSSLMTSVSVNGKAPYKRVLTHGFVCDETGKPYSKSSKNYEPPQKLISKNGAEVLRFWAAGEDFRNDMRFGPNILDKFIDAFKKIRNTYKHMLGCLADPQIKGYFDPRKDKVDPRSLWKVDRWMLDRLNRYLTSVEESFEAYEFHRVVSETIQFFSVDLSSRYLDITRDRLYTYRTTDEDRRSAQTVIYEVVTRTAAALAPILSFTTEDVWQHMWAEVFAPLGTRGEPNELNIPGSVHLCDYPKPEASWELSEPERMQFEKLFEAKDAVNNALENWRRQLQSQGAAKGSGNSMAAAVEVYAAPNSPEALALNGEVDLEEFFIVSKVQTSESNEGDGWVTPEHGKFSVRVSQASGNKCPRCWRYAEDVKPRPNLTPSASDFPQAATQGEITYETCDRCAEELA